MAVMQNSIIFGGIDSADFGIYISGEGVFNAPKRAVEMVEVPGRNGAVAIDQGRWENIEVTYPAFNKEGDLATFAQQLSDFRNALASQIGYQQLSDTFHPNEYRMALFVDGLEIDPVKYNTASKFEIKFDCKPQRWLTSGEIPVTIGEWGATKTASGEIVTIESEGGEAAKSLEVSLEPIQAGSGDPSPSNVRPISGRTSVDTIVSPTTSASDGRIYTTALGRTVYGGTLDVVSGVLTIDKTLVETTWGNFQANVDIGNYSRRRCDFTLMYDVSKITRESICNVSPYATGWTADNLHFYLDTATSFPRAWLYLPKGTAESTVVQIVYPLATPQTYQLTSQQIELLLGENHLWSDGAITLQYGDDPNSLYNPTRYDASPLLAVDGYGTISFNGYDIEITSGDYGDITIASPGVVDTNGDFYTIPAEYIKNGDTVTFTGLKLFCPVKFKSSNKYHFYGDGRTAPVPSDTNSDATSHLDPNRMPLYGTNATDVVTEVPSVRFTIGTSETWEDVITVAGLQVTEDYGETLLTEMTLTVTIRIDYDATTQKITFSESMGVSPSEYADSINYYSFGYRGYPSRIESVVVNSTMTYLGEPTYIDCDLGEAYKIENGTFISLNSYIDLGSDLPTLASGQNEITIDDTITSLEVTPRWWKL